MGTALVGDRKVFSARERRDPRLEAGRIPNQFVVRAERHEAEPVLAERGEVLSKVARPAVRALEIAATCEQINQ